MGVRSGSWASVGSDSGTRCYDCRSIHQATRSVDTMTAKRSKRALLPGVSITLVEGVNKRLTTRVCGRGAGV